MTKEADSGSRIADRQSAHRAFLACRSGFIPTIKSVGLKSDLQPSARGARA